MPASRGNARSPQLPWLAFLVRFIDSIQREKFLLRVKVRAVWRCHLLVERLMALRGLVLFCDAVLVARAFPDFRRDSPFRFIADDKVSRAPRGPRVQSATVIQRVADCVDLRSRNATARFTFDEVLDFSGKFMPRRSPIRAEHFLDLDERPAAEVLTPAGCRERSAGVSAAQPLAPLALAR